MEVQKYEWSDHKSSALSKETLKKKEFGFLKVHCFGPAGVPLGKALQSSQIPLAVI